MAKIKLKSLATEKSKIEKESITLAKRLKLADSTGELVVALELSKLLELYVLDLDKRSKINEILGVVTPNNNELVTSQKVEIALKDGANEHVHNSVYATILAKGASEELAETLSNSVMEVVRKASIPLSLSIGRLMKNKLSFTVDKVTHSVPTK